MKRLRAAVLVLICFSTFPAMAQRAGNARGAGSHTCGEFIDNKSKDDARLFYGQWAQGYLSAYNLYSKHAQVEVPEMATIMLHAEKYCRDNALGHFSTAVASLLADLGGWRWPSLR